MANYTLPLNHFIGYYKSHGYAMPKFTAGEGLQFWL